MKFIIPLAFILTTFAWGNEEIVNSYPITTKCKWSLDPTESKDSINYRAFDDASFQTLVSQDKNGHWKYEVSADEMAVILRRIINECVKGKP